MKSLPALDLIFAIEFYETPQLLWESEKILIQSLDILTFGFFFLYLEMSPEQLLLTFQPKDWKALKN